MRSKNIINLYFFVLVACALEPTLSKFLPSDVSSIIKLFDEFFILYIALFTFKNANGWVKRSYLFILAYFFVGLTSGILRGASMEVMLQGFALSAKGPCLLLSLVSVNFTVADLRSLFIKLRYFMFVIIIFALIDLLSGTALKDLLHLRKIFRNNIYILNGFFVQPADIAGFLFLGGFYFLKMEKRSFWFLISNFLGFLTLNVKEMLGNILAISANFKNQTAYNLFKLKNLFVMIFIIGSLTFGYIRFMPQHFNQYFVDNDGIARVMLYETAFKILKDDFPLGEGFGRYGGFISSKYYSPVYSKYNLDVVYGLERAEDRDGENFISDTYWPMIIGESGALGLVIFILLLIRLFKPLFISTSTVNLEDAKAFGRYLCILGTIGSLARPYFSAPPVYFWLFGITGVIIALIQQQSNKTFIKR